jgi:ankyrin repeat protein
MPLTNRLENPPVTSQANTSRLTHRASNQKLTISESQTTDSVPNRKLFQHVIQNNITLFRGMAKDVTPKDFQAVDKSNNTVLYYAVRNQSLEMMETLLKLGASVDRKCSKGETALHLACRNGHL